MEKPISTIMKYIIFCLIFISFSFNISHQDDDAILVGQILTAAKNNSFGKHIVVKNSKDNSNTLNVIKLFKKYSNLSSNTKVDSLKNDLGIFDNQMFESIFNDKEYEHLISQYDAEFWKAKDIKIKGISLYNNKGTNNKSVVITIGKPIYTIDRRFALVCVNRVTNSGIIVFKKDGEKWVEHNFIATIMVSPKIPFKE